MDAADEQLQNSSSVLSDAGSIIEEVEVSDAVHSFEPFEREESNELTWDHRGESDVTVRGISVSLGRPSCSGTCMRRGAFAHFSMMYTIIHKYIYS